MQPAEDSATSPDDGTCQLCEGTGTMSWQQPSHDGSVLRTIEMDCPSGCGDSWHHPHAERHRVVDQPDDRPTRVRGQADESQEIGADFIRAALANWGFDPHRR